MNRALKYITIAVLSIVLLAVLGLYLWFRMGVKEGLATRAHFEWFIAEKLFEGNQDFWPVEVAGKQRRPVTWDIDEGQLTVLDTIKIGLKNHSRERFYWHSWGTPLSRLQTDLVVYRNGIADSIPFSGFGCYTGVHLYPMQSGEAVQGTISNPLMFDPRTSYELPLMTESFPKLFESLYGDSVVIRFSQASYSLPWSRYPSQMLYSDWILVRTDRVLENWRIGRHTPFSVSEQILEERHGHKNVAR
ncbi:MAG: hypothetical protein IPK70_07675 [Flavobacteriales bacterium]|jgi:hypothetical protein|nr:hypothetical protein [Flavobacteriales bacterium]